MTPSLLVHDGGLWVVNKPAGWAAHPQGDSAIPDVLSWARESAGAPQSIAPIHRLDRATSGLILLSDDETLRASLGAELAAGNVRKRYRALVHGRTHAKGIVRRRLEDRRRGKPVDAVTRFTRRAVYGRVSLLDVRPETGRRHQIRRHFSGLGHHVVGDERYGPRRPPSVPGFPGRMWLHALALELPDGRRFEAPLPEELQTHLALLSERFPER